MIHSLYIHNFKCFEHQEFEFGNLMLLCGLNGTGKSSVLQSLLLLRQSYQQELLKTVGLLLNGDLIQLGIAKDVFYKGATKDEFGFNIDFVNQLKACWRFEYDREADVVKLAKQPVPDEVYNTSLFNDDFHYLSAERIGPRTTFDIHDYLVREHKQFGIRGEYATHFLSEFEKQKVQGRMAHPKEEVLSLKYQVEAWMGEISPGVRIDLMPYQDIDLIGLQYSFKMGNQFSDKYRSTNVGFGITYTLPVILALLASQPGALVLLENPEAHLHPKGQAIMGELIARAASCGIQILVETHSDHILNGIRIATRNEILAPEKSRIYFLDRREEDEQPSSRVISLHIDKNGRLDQWPDGFFDEWDKSLEKLI